MTLEVTCIKHQICCSTACIFHILSHCCGVCFFSVESNSWNYLRFWPLWLFWLRNLSINNETFAPQVLHHLMLNLYLCWIGIVIYPFETLAREHNFFFSSIDLQQVPMSLRSLIISGDGGAKMALESSNWGMVLEATAKSSSWKSSLYTSTSSVAIVISRII